MSLQRLHETHLEITVYLVQFLHIVLIKVSLMDDFYAKKDNNSNILFTC